MIICFNGDIGSGKSTIANKIAKTLKLSHFYMGQVLRDLAKKRKMTLVELLKSGEKDFSVDSCVDNFILKLAKRKNKFIIESRTAWHLIPESLKIYLKVSRLEGAKRVFSHLQKENKRKNEDVKLKTLKDVLKSNDQRRKTDNKRYKKYYNINLQKKTNYDFVLDTTKLSIEEVFTKTLEFINSKLK